LPSPAPREIITSSLPLHPDEVPTVEQPQQDAPNPRTLRHRLVRGVYRAFQLFLLLVVVYLLVALVGLIPVNNDFQPTPDGVEVVFTSTAVHADVVLPIANQTVDWREHLPAKCFAGDVSRATQVRFGWGNKQFYIATPTWGDLKVSTVLEALFWPSESCMHVVMERRQDLASGRAVRISVEQYERLVRFVKESFVEDEGGRFVLIEGAAYGPRDAFFEAHGRYHCFNTCNCWVGRAMRASGIRCGWFTPLPKTVLLYLPDSHDSAGWSAARSVRPFRAVYYQQFRKARWGQRLQR
jgi:uncharacterized protein (TIGR02117 family)